MSKGDLMRPVKPPTTRAKPPTTRVRSLVTAGAALVVTVGLAPPAAATTSESPASLHDQVVDAAYAEVAQSTLAHVQWADAHVNVVREAPGWAYGTVVLQAPPTKSAKPRDWLFAAHQGDDGWQVALDGQAEFAELVQQSPAVTKEEKAIFASHAEDAADPGITAGGDWRTGMRLPFTVGQTWTYSGGPHAYDAGTGPWSSIDLAGGDQIVRAARGGVAYTPCVGLVRIIHDRGYSTRYYHLISHPWFNGQSVAEGAMLGYTGVEVGCGGAANARHVHFSLEQHGGFVGIAGHLIGGWVFRNGARQYEGSALHGSRQVWVGGALYNYGRQGFNQGIVDTNGGGTLNKRSGPGTGYAVVGSVADGATVTISCSANGTSHTGRWGTSAMWNRLTDGSWVADAYLYTGTNSPVNGWC